MAKAEDVEIYPGRPAIGFKAIRRVEAKSEFRVRKELPSAADASERLRTLAARLGANAVIDARFVRSTTSGSYGAIIATGVAVVLSEDKTCPSCAETVKRKAVKCRHCGEELPPLGPAGPIVIEEPAPAPERSGSSRSPGGSRRSGLKLWHIILAAVVGGPLLLIAIVGILAPVVDPEGWKKTQAETKAKLEQEERQKQEKIAAEVEAEKAKSAAAEAAAEKERASGFHCLSGWDGSNRSAVEQVKKRLRDPDSFEHVETRIAPVKDGVHALVMTYRAKNGFGGTNVERAMATVDHQSCSAELLFTE